MSRSPAERADAPDWFVQALAAAPAHEDVEVEGVPVHYRAWGDRSLPGLVLVHGGAAHSGWWDHIAPQLHSHRVVAVDLSGHGDSGRRDTYAMSLWAREVAAVAAAEELDRPVVLGHSMGGWVALTIGVELPGTVSAVAVIDSPIDRQPPEDERLRDRRRRPHRPYPTAEEAISHFRTIPRQDVLLPYVHDHVARGSLRHDSDGWRWKFDPNFWGTRPLLTQLLPRVTGPVALFRCEKGMVSPTMAAEMAGLVGGHLPVVDLPDAGHHPMLDRPLTLVAGVRTLLAVWPHGA
ncbi:alpha/beta hydrolase [Blastococcus sp. CT_GayMR16]|uniref:alpha/beta fold hydrolase n=1 Tax=Blastococcus sp. CT_GayMR16 TaxID=2559607 RepID=UPI00107317BF|nr:alpha/beta hydrolase [Blastococcus sp. CT_GayMR16]TFV88800.1 alpha/beta hydrolase [Blastococcus sp. CT_GayMR16]